MLAEKPLIRDTTSLYEAPLLDELIANISTLSSVYHKPPESFVAKLKGKQKTFKHRQARAAAANAGRSNGDDEDEDVDDRDVERESEDNSTGGSANATTTTTKANLLGGLDDIFGANRVVVTLNLFL